MKLIKLAIISFTLFLSASIVAQDQCAPIGWANYDGQTYVGAPTGGGTTTPIEVTTFAQLKSAAESIGSKVIYIKNDVGAGYIGTTGDVLNVKSDKTIIGYAGVTVRCSWQVSNVSNIIIRNLTISGPGNSNSNQNWDAVNIVGSKRIWVDHCIVMDGEDGNFDIVKGSDNVSVTWCVFTYSAEGVHNLSNLVGSSDNEPESWGKLNITYANCWWKNVSDRQPRTRYGNIHVYNSYYSLDTNAGFISANGAGAGFKANNRNENNHYENINNPCKLMTGTTEGGNFPMGCLFTNCTGTKTGGVAGGYTVFTPPYTYTLVAATEVKAMVTNTTCGAGPTMDSPTQCGCTPLSTQSFEKESNINVYPNPVSNLLTIELEQEYANGAVIELYDALGKLILKSKATGSLQTLNLKNLTPGVYMVKVSNGNKNVVKRIIKQ